METMAALSDSEGISIKGIFFCICLDGVLLCSGMHYFTNVVWK